MQIAVGELDMVFDREGKRNERKRERAGKEQGSIMRLNRQLYKERERGI